MKFFATLKRRWYLIPVAVLVLLVVAFVVVSVLLGSIVRAGVATVLPKATGTPAAMGGFSLNPLTGTLRVTDFTVGNPAGYQDQSIFVLKELKVKLAPGSLLSDRIVVREILVDGLQVSYETKLTESNVGKIKESVDKFTKKGDKAEVQPPAAEQKQAGGQKKIQIDDLLFRNGAVVVRAGVAGVGTGATVPLPEIHLTGIGKEQEGATMEEAATEIFAALNDAIMKAVASAGSVTTDDVQKAGTKAAEGLVKGVKDLF